MTPSQEFDQYVAMIREELSPAGRDLLDSLVMLHHQIVGKAMLDGIVTWPVTVTAGGKL